MKKIDNEFIDNLFGNEYFCQKLRGFDDFKVKEINYEKTKQQLSSISQIDDVMDEVVEMMCKGMKGQFETLEMSNIQLYKQIERIKSIISPTIINNNVPLVVTQPQILTKKLSLSSPKQQSNDQFQTDMFFNSTSEMKEIRNTIKTLQSQILQSNQSILAQSFSILENSQYFDDDQRQGKQVQFMVECKIDEKFKTLQEKMNKMFFTYSKSIEQRVQQLKKTIISVVQAMNDPDYWSNKFQVKDVKKLAMSKCGNKAFDIQSPVKYSDLLKKEGQQNICQNNQLTYLNHQLNAEQKEKKVSTPSTDKSMNSLNKSINFGRKKIKSLFGFGGHSKNSNPQILIQ